MKKERQKIKKPYRFFPVKVRTYISFLRWFIPDSLWRNPALNFAILLSGFLGVAFQVKVFGLVIYFTRQFSTGEVIKIAEYSLDPRSSYELLGVVSLAVVLLLLFSTGCIFFSRRSIFRMGRIYEEFCAQRAFFLLGQSADVFSTKDNDSGGDSYILRLVRSDSRYCNRILCMLLSLIIPAITLIAALGILFYIEPFLTLIISLLSVIFTYYQYKVSMKAAGHSIQFEKLAPAANREYKAMIQHFKHQSIDHSNQVVVNHMFSTGPVKRQLDAYEGRLQSVVSSQLVSGIFMAGGVGLIILVMGFGIIKEGSGWGRLFIYIVALRFAMTNLQSTFSTLTSINRFYPQVRRYCYFIQSFAQEDREQYLPVESYSLQLTPDNLEKKLPGTLQRLSVGSGSRLALVTRTYINRYSLADLVKKMLGEGDDSIKSALYSMQFASLSQNFPHMTLRDTLGLGIGATWADLEDWFANKALYLKAQQLLSDSFDNIMDAKKWEVVNPKIKFILSLISARQSESRWIIVEAKGLKRLGTEQAKFYMDLFQDRIVVIVFTENFERVGSHGEHHVAVSGNVGLLGLGSLEWFASVRDRVDESLSNGMQKRTPGIGVSQEDEMDDLEDI